MRNICAKYNGTSHWAKLELPDNVWELVDLQLLMEQRFPLLQFNLVRALLDPHNIMANKLINSVLGYGGGGGGLGGMPQGKNSKTTTKTEPHQEKQQQQSLP